MAVVGLFVLAEVVEVGGCSYGLRVRIESKCATVVILLFVFLLVLFVCCLFVVWLNAF